ncbi:MAG: hypothetical protein AAFY29_15190 [Pseudomonadota bacterium]
MQRTVQATSRPYSRPTSNPTTQAAAINWSYPAPRIGAKGLLDKAFGPGHTRAELVLQILPPIAAALAVPVLAASWHLPWTLAQQLLAAFLALDGVGGVITNSTSSAKRWFHRAGQGPIQHLSFAMAHLTHFALVAWVFADGSLPWFIGASAFLMIAAPLVIYAPLYLQRPTAAGLLALGIVYSSFCLPEIDGMQWLLPVFYLKLLGAHLTREEPYRPHDADPGGQGPAERPVHQIPSTH